MKKIISVIGLGYVGLPVAVALSQHFRVIGFDKNDKRISQLQEGIDSVCEFETQVLSSPDLTFTTNEEKLAEANFFIVSVPTPIDKGNKPDLGLLLSASKTVARNLKLGDIVVYESTVYPGVTEDECVPVLEEFSGLTCGQDFHVGYSPERINPSDKEHDFANITKLVSAQNEETLDAIAEVYGRSVKAGVYKTSSIKVAEAAKVIENTQRDLNIALMNELAIILNKMNVDTNEVLDAASTKWNFLPFRPGLVGGHCIGVDPYYLTYCAEQLGYNPDVILAGRRTNDSMGQYIAEQAVLKLIRNNCLIKQTHVAILGFSFKENCADVRNTRVIDIVNALANYGIKVSVCDPVADSEIAEKDYHISLQDWGDLEAADAVIIAVSHDYFRTFSLSDLSAKLTKDKIILDVKGMLDKEEAIKQGFDVWRL